jgi:hypothetical protein
MAEDGMVRAAGEPGRPLPSAGQYHRNRPDPARPAEAAGGQRPVESDIIQFGELAHIVEVQRMAEDGMVRAAGDDPGFRRRSSTTTPVCRPSKTRCAGMKSITVQNAKRSPPHPPPQLDIIQFGELAHIVEVQRMAEDGMVRAAGDDPG